MKDSQGANRQAPFARPMLAMGLCALLLAGVLLTGCAEGTQNGQTTFKVACVLPADHPTSQALQHFKKRLGELSGGKMDAQLFLNGQLGNATETIESLQQGNIEMTVVSAAPLSQFVPEANALVMPYIFRDKQHQRAVLNGAVGDTLSRLISETGLKTMAFFDAGTRNIMTNSGPVRTPEDLQGRKIRVMSSNLMVDAVSALGASAVPMSMGEVYSALQTGVLDGWENNAPTALTFKMHETGCNHFAWTRHLAIPDLLLMDSQAYEGLSDSMRVHFDQAIQETAQRQRRLWREYEQEAVKQLKAAGVKFNEVDQARFANQMQKVYDKYYQRYGASFQRLCKRIQNVEASESTASAKQPSADTEATDAIAER